MDTLNSYTVCAIGIIAAIVLAVIVLVFKSPFHYPYFIHYFDVSGKRKPQIGDLMNVLFGSITAKARESL